MALRIDVNSPISDYVDARRVTVDQEETVTTAAKKMVAHGVGALIVTSKGEPTGMITERDVLNKVVAADRNPSSTKVSAVMSSPIRTIDYTGKVQDAISEMVKYGIRRLAVVKNGKVVGLLTQRSIVSAGRSQVILPELEPVEGMRCPYCTQQVKDQKALSKHIDLIHIGKGLLQGDVRKMEPT